MGKFTTTENSILHPVRAKYYPQADGTLRLASVQSFTIPKFREEGWESREKRTNVRNSSNEEDAEIIGAESDIARATRRAKKNAFDVIMCNPDLDLFGTFTYSPERVSDKASYDECYKYLNTWLSNRVQRNGLKYVCVPERTKAGDIHFHAIMNSSALKLDRAISPKSGRVLTHHGKPLYNIADWGRGFTSAEMITRASSEDDERAMVAKYIFKYMGKQAGQKIGGRYVLIGGDVAKPLYKYGESPQEFFGDTPAVYTNSVNLGDFSYAEWDFI